MVVEGYQTEPSSVREARHEGFMPSAIANTGGRSVIKDRSASSVPTYPGGLKLHMTISFHWVRDSQLEQFMNGDHWA